MAESHSRWSEIEHLPAWDEEFYDVYTAKKYGKWVMLKTLKPSLRQDSRYIDMINREFDVRYNLSHPNIVMINDFEDVPGVGLSIITDDVYGNSLRELLDTGKLTEKHYRQLLTRLPMAMEYIQQNHLAHHPLRPENIIFTENVGNLKLIDVGYDQKKALSHADTDGDLCEWGEVMKTVHSMTPYGDSRIRHIAERAAAGGYTDVTALQQAISGNRAQRPLIITGVCIILALIVALVLLLINAPAS